MATPSRLCAARVPAISAWFFTAFISVIGSAAARAACRRSPATSRVSASAALAWSSRTVLPLSCARSSVELAGRAHLGDLLQRVARLVVELGAVDIERRPALARDQREGERQRRMRHVGAADVEGPGDVLRIGHHQRIGAQLGQFGAHALELVGARFRRRA